MTATSTNALIATVITGRRHRNIERERNIFKWKDISCYTWLASLSLCCAPVVFTATEQITMNHCEHGECCCCCYDCCRYYCLHCCSAHHHEYHRFYSVFLSLAVASCGHQSLPHLRAISCDTRKRALCDRLTFDWFIRQSKWVTWRCARNNGPRLT